MKYLPAVAILCAMTPAAAEQRKDDGVALLVSRYVAWRGGAAFERIGAIHAEGTVQVSQLSGTIDRWVDRTGNVHEARDLGVLKGGEVIGPGGAWQLGMAGQVETMAAGDRADEQRTLAVVLGSALRRAGGARVSRAPDQQHGGRTWGTIHVTFGDADAYDLLVDTVTGELGGERLFQDNRTTFLSFSDWRMVGGVRMPFSEDVESSIPQANSHVKLTQITFADHIPAALIDRPAGHRLATFAHDVGSTGWMPFDLVAGKRIFIEVEINGVRLSALLDSGAQASVIDAAATRRASLTGKGQLPIVGVAGAANMSIANGAAVRIGDLKLAPLTLAVIDLSGLTSRIGRPIDLILGKEVLNEVVTEIDFPGRRLAFSTPDTFKAPAGASPIAAAESGGLRLLPATLPGEKVDLFHFDLGNSSPLVLYAAQAATSTLLHGRRLGKALVGGVGGTTTADEFVLPALTFGGVTFHDVPTTVMPRSEGVTGSTRVRGNLGLAIFDRFRLIIDYPHDRIWLTPLADAVSRPFQKDRSGLGLLPEDTDLLVQLVADGSPAEKAGLKVGDRISAIDGARIKADYTASALADWRFRPAGSEVLLTLADGTRRTLRLTDYY